MVRSIIVMTTRAEWRGEIFVVFIVVGALLRHNTKDTTKKGGPTDDCCTQTTRDTRTTASHVGLGGDDERD